MQKFARIGWTFGWLVAQAVVATGTMYGILAGMLYLFWSVMRAIRYAYIIVSLSM